MKNSTHPKGICNIQEKKNQLWCDFLITEAKKARLPESENFIGVITQKRLYNMNLPVIWCNVINIISNLFQIVHWNEMFWYRFISTYFLELLLIYILLLFYKIMNLIFYIYIYIYITKNQIKWVVIIMKKQSLMIFFFFFITKPTFFGWW